MGRAPAAPQHNMTVEMANPQLRAGFRAAARGAGLIAIAAGLIVLAGWALDIKALQSVMLGLASMKPLTALSITMLGLALWLRMMPTTATRLLIPAVICAGLAASVGLISLAEYLFDWNPGFDLIIFPKRLAAEPNIVFPGRMSAATAICIILIGSALALLDSKRPYGRWAVRPLAFVTAVIALAALIGYLYGAQSLYQIVAYSSMALHTAALLLILAMGTAVARPEQGIVAILTSDSAGGAAMRRLLPAGLIVPIVAGWLRLKGQQIGLYDTNFGLAIFALSNILIFATLVAWNGRRLHYADLSRRESVKSMRESEGRFQTIIDTMPSAVVAIDNQGLMVWVNPVTSSLFGYSQLELTAQPVEMLLPEMNRDAHSRFRETFFSNPSPRPMGTGRDLAGRRKDGTTFPVEIGLSFTETRDGPIAVAFISDITARKAAEGEVLALNTDLEQRVVMRTAQLEAANKELEAFSFTVSHDLRAPLQIVDGFSQILQEDYATRLDADGQTYLGHIHSNVQRMARLIDDLLSFSLLSGQPISRQTVNMSQLARDTLSGLTEADAGKDHVKISDMPDAEADPALLQQVFANLIGNALKFTRHANPPRIEVGHETKDGETVYFVRDNGAGFDMQHAAKLFGAFQRLHRYDEFEGTGIGLSICQRVVERHGGRIWADAEVGKGATFYFTIGKGDGAEKDRADTSR